MKLNGFRKILILASLAVFVAAGILAVLPHSHAKVTAGHDCLFCRAQSVQPSPALQAPAVAPLVFQKQLAVERMAFPLSESFRSSLSIRAPPVSA